MTREMASPRCCIAIGAAFLSARVAYGFTPTPEIQKAVRAGTFEVVLHKAEQDLLSYEKPLPLELIPYVIRSDHYWSIGSAFAIGPNTYVSAAHVLVSTIGSQFGAPALRDSEGHVYPVDRVLKFSPQEDFIVFTLKGAPDAAALATNENRSTDEVVLAAGNAGRRRGDARRVADLGDARSAGWSLEVAAFFRRRLSGKQRRPLAG
jgi:serine protease Do